MGRCTGTLLVLWAGATVAADADLDLAALLAEAEASNPAIQAELARAEAAEHLPSQLEARPDPMLAVGYTNDSLDEISLGESPDSVLEFSWTQEMLYSGKRSLAGDVARAEIAGRRHVVEATRLAVRSEVKRAYTALVRLDRTRVILEESQHLLESFRESARRRYEVGEGVLGGVLEAQAQLTRIEIELADLARERRVAMVALNVALGRPDDTPLPLASVLPTTLVPDPEALEAAAVDSAPTLLALRAATRRDEARLDLAQRGLKPDFLWRAAYGNRGDLDPMVTGMLGIKLPLYRKGKQTEGVAQTSAELSATRRDVEAAELLLRSEVRRLVAEADAARAAQLLHAEGLIPQSQSALDAAVASYASGRTEFVTVIANFRVMLEAERGYEERRAQEVVALTALEALTGATLVVPGGGGDE